MEAAKAADASGDDAGFVAAALGAGGIWVREQRNVVAQAAMESLWQRARTLAPAGSVEEARLAVRQQRPMRVRSPSPARVARETISSAKARRTSA